MKTVDTIKFALVLVFCMRAPGSRTPSLPLHRQEGGDKQLVSDAVIRPPARAVFHTNKRLSRSHYR